MADYNFENPKFDVDDVAPVDDDALLFRPEGNTTSGVVTEVGAGAGVQSMHQELLQSAVDDYYDAFESQGLSPTLGRDTTKFVLDEGRLRLKDYPNTRLINLKTGEPLALSTVNGKDDGPAAIKELGFTDWTRKKSLPAQAVAALQTVDRELGEAAGGVDTVPMQDLGQTAERASGAVQRIETSLTDADIDELLETSDDPPLNLREIRGLDRALQRIRGELTNNLAKLSELDKDIASETRKLGQEGTDEAEKRRIAERLGSLQDERAARLEAASAIRQDLRSQINRVRETISRILHEDTTLAERIRTLFREQGITIASILTAVGMAISTLVLALTGGGGGAPSPPPPRDKGGVREWLKKHLRSLGRLLATLAGKAAAALPGVIGSVVSWLLGAVAKTTGWLASNLWALVLAAGGALLFAAREWISRKPKHE